MYNFRYMKIKHKIVLGIAVAVLASTVLVGVLAQQKAKEVLTHRLVDIELPLTLDHIKNEVNGEVSQLISAATQIANNEFLLDAIAVEDRDPVVEQKLVQQLNNVRDQYQLMDATIANRQTAYFWNQNGFLRQLNKVEDNWFFGFTESNQETSVSIFQETNGDVKMFANFQQLNGMSMSGLSKSLNDMVSLLNGLKIEETGFVFLADSDGRIKIHHQSGMLESTLSSIYGPEASKLLNTHGFNMIRSTLNGQEVLVATTYIESMKWYAVGVVPVDEVFADLNDTAKQITMFTLAIAVAFIFIGLILASSITKPIESLEKTFTQLGQGGGDLAQRIEVNGNDEMAKLALGFNSFIEKIHQTISDVAETSYALQEAASGVASKASTTYDNSQNQRDQTIQVVAAINEMGETINEIASNAALAAQIAGTAESNTEQGRFVVEQAKEAISHLAANNAQTEEVVKELASTTQSIGSILEVIRAISEQTNLLALNAAIEAARAGEQGRGFAVVADEVRNLASRTADSTDEIQKMINKLQADARNAVVAMEAGQSVTQDGVVSSDKAVEMLQTISAHINDISDRNTQVATATEEQSTVVYTINENIYAINSINEMTTTTAQELATASQELQTLSRRLDSIVNTFKL
ncbi:methyl-accepting chemotaxis protein [Vibrio sinensis]|uniref:Methyl-accepting chemotaxis protein n=1 Tax=Vibrio sinensis TaxID=2302434 RepID=A0A3A6QRL1_9VIBR|nr:methyl-accepting chemotaxis protein [Vibrio sinensis]RJX75540.1 methyl-accepting chemotaxis protein [Vibrio sinensis]